MINGPLVVSNLTVQVVTGDTCYPGEDGFSSISAEVAPEDPKLIEQLADAQKNRQMVTLRCAMLDTTGRITKSRSERGKKTFVQVIDDIAYRKPSAMAGASTK